MKFIKLAESEKPYEATASVTNKTDDVKELIKDIQRMRSRIF
jgi:hypothetical protein